LETIHIFAHNFASEEILSKLLKHYPNLKVLTLNCNHSFSQRILNDLSESQLTCFTNLEVKWDFSQFFDEYYLKKYYPDKNIKKEFKHT
jgi:hypothetical protein